MEAPPESFWEAPAFTKTEAQQYAEYSAAVLLAPLSLFVLRPLRAFLAGLFPCPLAMPFLLLELLLFFFLYALALSISFAILLLELLLGLESVPFLILSESYRCDCDNREQQRGG